MRSAVTTRLDDDTRRRVTHLARRKRIAFSKAVRMALREWADREERQTTPYELIKHLIGSVRSGDPKLSEDMGRKFGELLRRRRRTRGSR